MSDSEDFDGFQHGTPDATRPAHGAKPSANRPQAGPSRNAAAPKPSKKPTIKTADQSDTEDPAAKKPKAARARKPQEAIAEVEETEDKGRNAKDDDDDIEELDSLPHNPKASLKKPAPRPNGPPAAAKPDSKTDAKGKAKAKPKPIAKPTTRPVDQDVMDVDKMDEDVDEDAVPVARPAAKARVAPGNAKPLHRPRRNESEEVARLTEQLSQAQGFIDDLKKQLTELYTVRHTEPELLMERMEQQHAATLQAQNSLVKELTEKLAQHDPNFRRGKNNVFELLTRDEVDKETQALQDELEKYKKLVNEKDRALKEKDKEIESLRDDQRALKIELQAEIERAKALVEKSHRQPPGSATRNPKPAGATSTTIDPKHTEIIKFYEDLSNVLVLSMKAVPGRYFDLEEWLLNCCYTYRDVTDPNSLPKSLSFTLRLCYEPEVGLTGPVQSKEQLVESVQYLPKDLDKESAEFRADLDFLAGHFTFERTQLSLFMRTMAERVSGEKTDPEEGEDDSIMVVE